MTRTDRTSPEYPQNGHHVHGAELALQHGLPVDTTTEKLVLGSMMLYPQTSVPVAMDLLGWDAFSITSHQRIFARMAAMTTDGAPIDRITLYHQLVAKDGFGATTTLSDLGDLTEGLPQIHQLDTYCRQLAEKAFLRKAIALLSNGLGQLTSPAASRQTVEEIQSSIANLELEADSRASGFEMLSDIIDNAAGGGPGKFLSTPPEEAGIPWPLHSLTNATGGFRPGNTTVIGAETGGGKTTMATMCALHAAKLGYGVAILSAEMTKWEVSKKIIAQHGRLCLSEWLQGSQSKDERNATRDAVNSAYPLVIAIDERPDVTPAMLEAGILRLRRKHKIDLVIVDYLQLMESGLRDDGSSRERHIAFISRSMKKMCKRLGLAGIVLTQLNDDGKVRESRQIKMDASNVVILSDKGGGNFEATLEKARFSARRRISLFFDGATGLFFEVDNR